MEILLGGIIGCIFLYINGWILYSDLKLKRIPNKYLRLLIYLLPIWYIYINYYGYIGDIYLPFIFIQLIVSFCITFLLFNFGIWGAGDAKYLLILYMYLYYLSIATLIGNIGITVIVILSIYYIYFFGYIAIQNIGKQKTYSRALSLVKKIKYIDILNKELINKLGKFFILFIIFRFLKVYGIDYILKNHESINLESLLNSYWIHLIGSLLLIKLITFIIIKFSLKDKAIKYATWLIYILGVYFIAYEFYIDGEKAKNLIGLILSLYLIIYIIFLIIKKSILFVFHVSERFVVNWGDLKEGMILDLSSLKQQIGKKENLLKLLQIDDIDTLHHPNTEEVTKIKKVIRISNTNKIRNKKDDETIIEHVTVIRATAFSYYIFFGACITVFFEDNIISFILNKLLEYFIQI